MKVEINSAIVCSCFGQTIDLGNDRISLCEVIKDWVVVTHSSKFVSGVVQVSICSSVLLSSKPCFVLLQYLHGGSISLNLPFLACWAFDPVMMPVKVSFPLNGLSVSFAIRINWSGFVSAVRI